MFLYSNSIIISWEIKENEDRHPCCNVKETAPPLYPDHNQDLMGSSPSQLNSFEIYSVVFVKAC